MIPEARPGAQSAIRHRRRPEFQPELRDVGFAAVGQERRGGEAGTEDGGADRDEQHRPRISRSASVHTRPARDTRQDAATPPHEPSRGSTTGGLARYVEPLPGSVPEVADPGSPLEERETLILSAAQDFERAWSMKDENGTPHGAFTLSLLRALGAAGRQESAARVFLRARSRLRAEGFEQEPVIAGPEHRRAAPLFGGRARTWRTSAAVLGVEDDGTIILQGGWATGLSQGSELRRVRRDDEEPELRLRIVSAELTRSRTEVIDPDAVPQVAVGDLFELDHWAVPEEASLRVRMPAIDWTSARLRTFASALAAIAEEHPRIQWVVDPVAETPTHVLSWRGGSAPSEDEGETCAWRLRRGDGRERQLGPRPEAEALRRELLSEGAEVRLFVHLPLPSDLRLGDRLGAGTPNDAVAVVSDSSQANYLLAGRLRRGRLEYAWVRPEVSLVDGATSSLPLRSRWLALGEGEDAIPALERGLEDLALRLGKIRAWLTLESPRAGVFPYRLALRNGGTREIKPGASAAPGFPRLTSGERYGVVLVASREELTRPFEPLYVYAFFLDSLGRSKLLFPRGYIGSVENRLPVLLTADSEAPVEIPLGDQPLLEITEPWGVDTYFLLTTSESLPDPFVLDFDGVRDADPNQDRGHPLERLLRHHGGSKRRTYLTPTTWSIDRVSFEVVAAREP